MSSFDQTDNPKIAENNENLKKKYDNFFKKTMKDLRLHLCL